MPLLDLLKPHLDRQSLAGAVLLVAGPDGILEQAAGGWADIPNQRLMRLDSIVWVASVTKLITSSAFAMLLDSGAVRLEDPLATYLPEFGTMWVRSESSDTRQVLTKAATTITLKHLLTHTSGLPFNIAPEAGVVDRLTLREAVSGYACTPLLCEPGTAYNYSNAGINCIGRVIEVVSGMSYERFLQERLLSPLGMHDATFRPTPAQLTRLAKAYTVEKDRPGLQEVPLNQLTYPLDAPTRTASPSGGLFASATDLACFGRMLLREGELDGRRYLKPETVRLIQTNHVAHLPNMHAGLACGIDAATGGYGHGGAYGSDLHIQVRARAVTVYLVQIGTYGGEGGSILGALRKYAVERCGAAQRGATS